MFSLIKDHARLIFVGFWMSLLYLIATNIQAGWLYVVISFLALLCVYSLIIPRVALRPIEISLELPEMCERGSPATGTLYVRNTSRYPRFMIRVELPEKELAFDPPNVFMMRIEGNRQATAPVVFTPTRRGRIELTSVAVSCSAPAGIVRVVRNMQIHADTLVYPRISQKEGERQAGAAGDESMARREKFYAMEDPYNYKLREYAPGDSLHRLHWKLTAKRNKPIMRVHERKIFGHSGILVDNLREHYPEGAEERFEDLLEKAISLAYYLLFARGSSVTVAATAAPEIALETPDMWNIALRWFALIQLESVAESAADERASNNSDFLFSPEKEEEKEEKIQT